MEEYTTQVTNYNRISTNLRNLCKESVDHRKERVMNQFREFIKTEKVFHQAREEQMYLTALHKLDSKKFLRLRIKLQLIIEQYRPFLEEGIVTAEQELNMRYGQENRAIFERFCMERVRERRDGYNEVTGEIVTLKEISRSLKRFCDLTNSRRIPGNELELLCEDVFGDSEGKKNYMHIRVFLEEEDAEEFDRQHLLRE